MVVGFVLLTGLVSYVSALEAGNSTVVGVTLLVGGTGVAFLTWRVVRRVRRWQQEQAAIASYQAMLRSADLARVDRMSGREFEEFLALLFQDFGYRVETTKVVGDYGGDLVLVQGQMRIVVQVKRYSGKVGQEAVRQAGMSRPVYQASIAAVVTNSWFTPHAVNLAAANGVHLIDRSGLHQLVEARWRRVPVPVALLPGLPAALGSPTPGVSYP